MSKWITFAKEIRKGTIPPDRYAKLQPYAADPKFKAAETDCAGQWGNYVAFAKAACDDNKITRLTEDQLSVIASLLIVAWLRGANIGQPLPEPPNE